MKNKILKDIENLGISSNDAKGKNGNRNLVLPPVKNKRKINTSGLINDFQVDDLEPGNKTEIIELLSNQIEIEDIVDNDFNLNDVEEEIVNEFRQEVESNRFNVSDKSKLSFTKKIKNNKMVLIIIMFFLLYLLSKGAVNLFILIAPLLPVIIGIAIIAGVILFFTENKSKFKKVCYKNKTSKKKINKTKKNSMKRNDIKRYNGKRNNMKKK